MDRTLIVQIKDNDQYSKISLLCILSWMKSTLYLWFLRWHCKSQSGFPPKIFRQIPIPTDDILFQETEIESIAKEIIHKEQEFLEKGNSYFLPSSQTDILSAEEKTTRLKNYYSYVQQHNDGVLEFLKSIDTLFFSKYGISEDKIRIIQTDLDSQKIFNYFDNVEET